MPGIFISYRRDDAEGQAGRLFDGLRRRFGKDRVFMDRTGLRPGKDYKHQLNEAARSCDVMLVVIGKSWLGCRTPAGTRRLDDIEDWVRVETGEGLRRGIPVVPVLVQGARLPEAGELPEELKPLADRQAVPLAETYWDENVAAFVQQLADPAKGLVPVEPDRPRSVRPPLFVAAALIVISIGVALLWNRDNPTNESAPVSAPASTTVTPAGAPPPSERVALAPDLRVTALAGLNAPKPLDGYAVIKASATAPRMPDGASVYPRGAKIAVDLSHNRQGDASITLRSIELLIDNYLPGGQRTLAYKGRGDQIIGAGPITPLVYRVALFRDHVGPAMRVTDPKRGTGAIARSANFLDTEEPQLFQLSKQDDSQSINIDVTAEDAGLYEIGLTFTYSVLGETKRQRTQPSIWIYYDGR